MNSYHIKEINLFFMYLLAFIFEPVSYFTLFLPLFFSQEARSLFIHPASLLIITVGACICIFYCRLFWFFIFLIIGKRVNWKIEIFFRIRSLTNQKGERQ